MGPQHPSTHGVLRLVLTLDGETVVDCVPHMGYLHTGMEKQCEHHKYYNAITITDRMDYLSPMTNNLAYCLAVEKLMGLPIPERAQVIRVILAETSRIASHLVWLATAGLELGAMSVFLYCFREREMIMDAWEEVAGGRITPSFVCVGGVLCDVTDRFVEMTREFLRVFPSRLADYERLLSKNPIWLRRTQGVGALSTEELLEWGVTGPILRASGMAWDLRKDEPYCSYDRFEFDVPTGTNSDAYDRYLVRVEEMRQSHRIIQQALDDLPDGPVRADEPHVTPPPRDLVHQDMHRMIYHFKFFEEGFSVPAGAAYAPIEGPKGEIGFYIVSDGGPQPYRVRVRPPSLLNLQALPDMVRGRLLADVVSVIASIDFVLGEVDR
jgi:NADH-quinone oxidoreductase subunit D